MTTDELNAIVQAVMTEMEKAGVDFDFKAETPQPTDLVYVMRGTSDKYKGITVKWQNLLDIIVKKATDAKNEAVSAKDIALQTLATIQGIESNVSSMKSSVETSEANVASMKASVEASEANVTQMKASVESTKTDVEGMKTSVEGTKIEVENIKEETAGLLDTKVNKTDALTYEEIMATTDLTNKVASASAFKSHAKVFTSSIAIPYSDNNISLIRAGNVVQCSHYGDTISPIPNGDITFGNIPDGYKPIKSTATETLPNGNNIVIYTYINTLLGYNYRGSELSGSFRFSMTWITNDPFPTT